VAERWLLIETFGGEGHHEPTVIGIGSSPKGMVSMSSVLGRGHYLPDAMVLVARVIATGQPLRIASSNRARQMIGDPLIAFSGRVHGVHVWIGRPDEEPPPRDPAGAWYFNLTTGKIGGSDDLLDLYGVPIDERRRERAIAEAFSRLTTNADEAAGLAVIVQARPGAEHQATWTVRRDDGQLRAANFACRAVQATNTDGRPEIVLRGITHDIGPAETVPSAPTRMVLAQQVLAAQKEPGRHRAIVNLRTLSLLRWLDDPMPGIAWENDTTQPPGIHPDDLPLARRMRTALAGGVRITDTLRLQSTIGAWTPVRVEASLMLLDEHTTAAYVVLSEAEPRCDPPT
jgi:hypothetical protein